MTTSKEHFVGHLIGPDGKPQNVEFISKARPNLTTEERAAGIGWVDYRYPPGDVRRYGAKADGTTDDSAALQTAIDACEGAPYPMVLEAEKTYVVSTGLTSTGNLTIEGNGATIQPAATTAGLVVNPGADVGTTTLSADAQINTNAITVTSATNITVGALIKLTSTAAWHYDPDTEGLVKGELTVVKEVVGTALETDDMLFDNYDVSGETVTVTVITDCSFICRDLKIAYATPTAATGLQVQNCINGLIDGVTVNGAQTQGINLDQCYGMTVRNCKIYRANNSGLGYGVQLNECTKCRVLDSDFWQCRRGVDFSGTFPSRLPEVSGCSVDGSGDDSTGTPLPNNTGSSGVGGHETCEHSIFRNNRISNVRAGVLVRGPNTLVEGNYFVGDIINQCVLISRGANVTVKGNTYSANLRPLKTLDVVAADDDNQKAPWFVKFVDPAVDGYYRILENQCDDLKNAFCVFSMATASQTINNVVIGNNVALLSGTGATTVYGLESNGVAFTLDGLRMFGNKFTTATAELTIFDADITLTNHDVEVNVRDWGAAGDGTTDDSAVFASALTLGDCDVEIPSGTYYLDGSQILVASGTHVKCSPGATIQKNADGVDGGWIRFRDVTNCSVQGGTWEYVTKPTANEGRHIFDLRGCSDVVIRDTQANKAGGDGYFVGEGAVNDYSERVLLENVRADNCRRQGISVVSGIDIRINDPILENITGTAPQAGIDIEPDVSTDELKGIRIKNPITRNCSGPGIKAVINDLPTDYELDIVIDGHFDDGSESGFNPQYGTEMLGRIAYNDAQLANNGLNGIFVRGWQSNSSLIDINRPTIINPNDDNDTTNAYQGNGISIYAASPDTQTDIGNVIIREPRIIDNRGTTQMKDGVYARTFVTSIVDTFVDGDVTTGTDRITLTAHSLTNNDACLLTTTGTLPAGLALSTEYFVGVVDANTIELYSDYDLTSIVDITAAAGGGTHTLTTQTKIRDISVIDPIEIVGYGATDDAVSLISVINYLVTDPRRILIRDHTANGNVSISDHYSVETNEGATGTITLTLDDDIEPGPSLFTFEVREAQILRVDPEASSGIFPGSNGNGNYIQATAVGDRLTIRRHSSSEWFIHEEIGTWARE